MLVKLVIKAFQVIHVVLSQWKQSM